MSYDVNDPMQLLQLRVGALEYFMKQIAAAQPQSVRDLIEEETQKQIAIWKDKSPEVVEIMESALSFLPNK